MRGMTNASESIIETPGSMLPIPINDMVAGYFWARKSSIFPNGDPISDLEIRVRMDAAYNELMSAPSPSRGIS